MKISGILTLWLNLILVLTFQSSLCAATLDEVRTIAKDAWLYAFPMMESYNTWYSQAVDSRSPTYIGGFNTFRHYSWRDTSRVCAKKTTPILGQLITRMY
jgi:hypothetical protein